MKRLLLTGICTIFAAAALAEPIEQGTYEVQAGLSYDLDFPTTLNLPFIPARAGMGYYVMDNLQVGGFITGEKRKWESAFGEGNVWGIGAFGEYVLDLDLPVMPTCAVSVKALDSDLPRDLVVVLSLSPGLRLALTDSVALALNFDVNLASDEIYSFERNWVDQHQPYPQDNVTGVGKRVGYTVGGGVRVMY